MTIGTMKNRKDCEMIHKNVETLAMTGLRGGGLIL